MRNQETLKNQLKYEKRATRINDTAIAAAAGASGVVGGVSGVEGEGGEGVVSEGDVLVDMVQVSGEKSGRGKLRCSLCCLLLRGILLPIVLWGIMK